MDPGKALRKSHVSFAHAQQRFDTIRAEPFLVQFSLLARKKGLCSQGDHRDTRYWTDWQQMQAYFSVVYFKGLFNSLTYALILLMYM